MNDTDQLNGYTPIIEPTTPQRSWVVMGLKARSLSTELTSVQKDYQAKFNALQQEAQQAISEVFDKIADAADLAAINHDLKWQFNTKYLDHHGVAYLEVLPGDTHQQE